jgi:alpha-galactosidase
MVTARGMRQVRPCAGFLAILLLLPGCGDRRLTAISGALPAAAGAPSDGPDHPEPDACAPTPPPLLPPLGWNGWNEFRCRAELDQQKFLENADALLESGMRDAGYVYANLDDCWQAPRGADGALAANARFPDGMAALARQLHDRGLKLGIDAHNVDCQRPELTTPGSIGHETSDAGSFAEWGVDYVKYARCGGDGNDEASVAAMRLALQQTGRPMRFTLVAPPFEYWQVGAAEQRRTHEDIEPSWEALLDIVDTQQKLAAYTGPGGLNDADMLWVGNAALTQSENRAHFSLWALFASPLLAGNDLTQMSTATADILTNRELIAIDQDPLVLQGVELERQGEVSVFAKPLSQCGARAVVLLNRGQDSAEASVTWAALGLAGGAVSVRDLWAQQELEPAADGITLSVPGHDVRALGVVGVEPPLPRGSVYLSDLSPSYAANGWGPVERDQELGGQAGGDGMPLMLGGTRYDKGLGTNSPSLVRYVLGRRCRTFATEIGIDDATGDNGSAIFQVWADGEKLFDSGVMYGTTPPRHVELDVSGRSEVRLFVGEVEDFGMDHADWADARLLCDE